MSFNKKPLSVIIKSALTAAALSLSVPNIAIAEETTGVIRGSAEGATGAVVRVVNIARGTSQSITLDEEGNYRFSSLPPGKYLIEIVGNDQVLETQQIEVRLGGTTIVDFETESHGAIPLEELVVTAGRISAADAGLATAGIVVTAEELNSIPVSRDLTSVTMLAPGVTRGDTAFGGTSFSGASVAENVTYINGLNVTNFRNGLGFSKVPFEAYESIQVKTGGYSAKFGRSTGGVVNAVVKSGSNEFDFGANVYTSGDLKTQPDTYSSANKEDDVSTTVFDIYGGGALIEDRLFFYGLYNSEDYDQDYGFGVTSGRGYEATREGDFWLAKVDAYITDNHRIELLGFSDGRDTSENTVTYDYDTGERGDVIGNTIYSSGGENFIATYVGQLTDNLEMTASYGENNYERSVTPDTADCPILIEVDAEGNSTYPGCWGSSTISAGEDTRKMYRLDFSWDLGDHYLQFGYDNEKNTAIDQTAYSGDIYYRMVHGNGDPDSINGGNDYVRATVYETGGSFEVHSEAMYIQDTWMVTDNLEIELGIRNDSFTNYNGEGEEFVAIDNQWAPRFSASWDPIGDGNQSLFMNAGLYYLPVAANTNIRMSGAETFIQSYYDWDGESKNADGTPIVGEFLYDNVLADGSVPDTRSTTDQNIESMYQSELIIGYEWVNSYDWTWTVKGIWRNLERSIEDVAIDAAVIDYYNSNGTWDASMVGGKSVEDVFSGFHQYVLTNPGNDMSVYIPEMDEYISLSSEQLRYPDPERKYGAVEFSFDRPFDGKWSLNGSYTWAHNWGNSEGYVKSDNGQDDAGITQDFDQPGLTDGAYGDLPNDRRHSVKAFGSYQFDNGILLGVNYLFQTGRPVSCMGVHPTDEFAQAYEAASFYCDGKLTPRGSAGTTGSLTQVDLKAQYTWEFAQEQSLQIGLDVFNIFNAMTAIEVNEYGEQDSGASNPFYQRPTSYQTPMSYRLSARYNF